MEVRQVEADADRLPLGVVEVRSEEDPLPLVEQTRVQIQLAVGQFQAVKGLALTDGQESVGQRRAESQRQVVAFVAVRLYSHERRAVEGHGGRVLAQLAVEAEWTLAGELVKRLLLQEGHTRSSVQAGDVDAAQQFHRAVLAAVVGRALALVVGYQVDALAVDARLQPVALVDLQLAVAALVARQTAARVVVDAVDARAEFARPRAAQRALIDVDLAVGALEAGQTAAHVPAGSVVAEVGEDGQIVQRPVRAFQAGGAVLARNSVALVYVHLAVLALVAGETLAHVVLHLVDAQRSVHARRALAVVHVDLAVSALESRVGAVAFVRVNSVDTQPLVQTRRRLDTMTLKLNTSNLHVRH